MSDAPDRRAQAIFRAALNRAADKRSAYLDDACGNDADLRRRVEALLRSDDVTADESRTAEIPPGPLGAPPENDELTHRHERGEQAGAMIGRYKLLERIGEGGFGSVWAAEQKEPVKRRVALKIIKLGMDTKQVIARFEAERQALAILDHPNIAKVFDAGVTETGRPYFVMELCPGELIDVYCDRNRLTVEDRLALFSQVCAAVQHAHTKGIIHRDIKPSNVLVSSQEGKAHVKVIDFGVAKATAGKLTEQTLFTQESQVIGTPEYMSPEQVEGSLDIDTRTDVYALGVLLYQLLTGSTPFTIRELRAAGLAEIQRIIREVDPPRPSTRLSRDAATVASVAASRHIEPHKLGLLLRGDLDWIVMKALEKDRARRYDSASALARDLQNHLTGMAVEAAPPSAAYRLRKFIRRNRVAVSAALAVSMSLLIGVVAFAWQAQVASAQRDEAQRSQHRSELIAEFMSDMLKGVGPSVAKGRDTTMLKEMMDHSAARIENGDLKEAPEAERRLRETVGNTYRELAAYPEAAKMLEPAVPLSRSIRPGDSEETADALTALASLYQDRGDLAKAEPLFREALDMNRRLHAGDNLKVAAAMGNLATLLMARGDLKSDEPLFREALAMDQRLHPGDHATVAADLNNLAAVLHDRGDLAGAEAMYRQALDMTRRLSPGDSPQVAGAINNLGYLLYSNGDLANAEPLYREALAMSQRLFPDGHPGTARYMNNLAFILQDRGDLSGAEALFRQSLDMDKRLFPGDHPEVASGLGNLASVVQRQGDLPAAEALFRESLEMNKRMFPGDHPAVAKVLCNLGLLRGNRGDLDEAEELLHQAVAMDQRLYAGDHPETAASLFDLGTIREARGDLRGSEELLRQAVEMYRRLFPNDHPDKAHAMGRLASILGAGGKLEEAESLHREALAIDGRLFPGDSPTVSIDINNLANVLRQRGDLDGAADLFRQSLAMARRLHPGDSSDVALGLHNLGFVLRDKGDLDEAESLLREALAMYKRLSPNGSEDVNTALTSLARLLQVRGDLAGLESAFRELVDLRKRLYPADSMELLVVKDNLARLVRNRGDFAGAESLYREMIAMLDGKYGKDHWYAANARLGLGISLAGLNRFAEAEPELVEAQRVLSAADGVPAGRLQQCIEALVSLYESWDQAEPNQGHDEDAAKWKSTLEAVKNQPEG